MLYLEAGRSPGLKGQADH